MSNVYILNENYLSACTQTYSSQNTSYPASNVAPGVRRTKVWRSSGCWEISSANNTIIFRDDTSVDKTATITAGTYTSDTTFLAAIDTALEAAGAANYTVTRDTTTNRIKITSDLSGGATAFQLRCADGGFTAASILGFSTASHLTGAATYTADSLKLHTGEWIKWDLGVAGNPKAFIAIGTRNEALKLSSNATVKLQGSTTDSWTSPEYSQTLTITDYGLGVFSSTGLHTSGLRYWRLSIVDTANAYGYVEMAKCYLGEAVIPTTGAVQFPLNSTLVDYGERTIAKSGNVYYDVAALTEILEMNWSFLTKSEKEELEDFVRTVGLSTPFFVCLDPDENFSTDLERYVKYVRFDDPPKFSLVTPNNFSSDWSIREEL
jgi:hypothetical protein